MLKKIKLLFSVFSVFFRIGSFTFGGGYAMIPLIQKETVEKKKWVTDSDILDIVAIAESTPGPIAINAATFVGFKVAGFFGAFCATFGIVIPSFLVILVFSFLLKEFGDIKILQYVFNGIRAGVLALIIKALISMYRQAPKNLIAYIIMAVAFILTAILNINILYVIIGCAVAGVVSSAFISRRCNK